MRVISAAIIAGALCICSAIADAAPASSITRSIDQTFWSVCAGAALMSYIVLVMWDWKKNP